MRLAEAVRPVILVGQFSAVGTPRLEGCVEHTCVNHDQELHEPIIDVAWRCGLDDEDVLVSYGLAHCDTGLLVGVIQAHGLCDLYAQPAPPL